MSEQVLLVHAMLWIVRQSGILGAVTGFVAAGLLAWPALSELRDRREWETLSDVHRRATSKAKESTTAANATDSAPAKIAQIQWEFLERRMGQFYSQRRLVLGGFLLLILSFALTVIEKLTAAG